MHPSTGQQADTPELQSDDLRMRRLVIAIDGPSGAGKGTIARAIARGLQYRHIDTGAMYRAVALLASRLPISLDDESAVAAVAENAKFELEEGTVRINGRDVTQEIRTSEMDGAAAAVARLPRVRQALVRIQRAMGTGGAVVMEGRDIGTVVFPKADVKIYLDATPQERARRRAADPVHACGANGVVAEVASALEARDLSDRTRTASPLAIASDAVMIDTTGVSVEEVVRLVMAVVREKLERS